MAEGLGIVKKENTVSTEKCECEYFFVAEIHCDGLRVRLRPQSLDGLVDHVGSDKAMAMGLLLEVARTLGQLGFVASREGVAQAELKVNDPMSILTGQQSLPWRVGTEGPPPTGLIRTMVCCEGHGSPYYCTARN